MLSMTMSNMTLFAQGICILPIVPSKHAWVGQYRAGNDGVCQVEPLLLTRINFNLSMDK